MNLDVAEDRLIEQPLRSWRPYVLLLGIYLSLRGYHSFDGDQAYRLPLLLHRQDPNLYAEDPFVRSVDEFNPHRGSLALLDAVSRPMGLPVGLFVVFALTFMGTCRAISRLASATWPDRGPSVGWVAVCLFLAAKAGNIGTNHLFEAMVLDRLLALALGWLAIADALTASSTGLRRPSIWISAATVIHPSIGVQLAMVLGASWLAWALFGRISRVNPREAVRGVVVLALAIVPGLAINLPQGTTLWGDLTGPVFWILSVELQNPQHMLPHLWRMPQWLAWFSYLVLAVAQCAPRRRTNAPARHEAAEHLTSGSTASRSRLTIMLAVIAVGLGAAWWAIEIQHDIRATVFQPFRMSTVIRGIAIVLISGRLVALWRIGGLLDRTRATVLATGFVGDWLLVVATIAELSVSVIEAIPNRMVHSLISRGAATLTFITAIALGLNFLAHHDTESGHIPLLVALAVSLSTEAGTRSAVILSRLLNAQDSGRTRRLAAAVGMAWTVPCGAILAAMIPAHYAAARHPIVRGLVERCRICPIPLNDIERLAFWCREHTPPSARFIGPPGPKTFRLWSRRNLAFSRAGSPYHGAGLADWFERFQDHVDFRGTPEEFVRAYRDHRHEFEARYDSLSDAQLAALALRQGAEYIIAEAPKSGSRGRSTGLLEQLHVEGRYAAYRIDPASLVHRHP
jgi:hypothetical protein